MEILLLLVWWLNSNRVSVDLWRFASGIPRVNEKQKPIELSWPINFCHIIDMSFSLSYGCILLHTFIIRIQSWTCNINVVIKNLFCNICEVWYYLILIHMSKLIMKWNVIGGMYFSDQCSNLTRDLKMCKKHTQIYYFVGGKSKLVCSF